MSDLLFVVGCLIVLVVLVIIEERHACKNRFWIAQQKRDREWAERQFEKDS